MSNKDQLLSFLQQSAQASAERAGVIDPQIKLENSLPPFDLDLIAKKVAELDLVTLRSLMSDKENRLQQTNTLTRQLREIRTQLQEIDRRVSSFGNEEQFIKERKRQLERVFKNLLIAHVEYVENNVTIFTTQFLKRKNIVLGIFRIWIDWNREHASSAIRILNFYKRDGSLDHPCIMGGDLCMGTAAGVIEQHFRDKNVFVLLETLMAFILSENIEHGYTHDWEQWSKACRKVPINFSFDLCGIRPARTSPRIAVAPSPNSNMMQNILEQMLEVSNSSPF